jgi:hypothetical protein
MSQHETPASEATAVSTAASLLNTFLGPETQTPTEAPAEAVAPAQPAAETPPAETPAPVAKTEAEPSLSELIRQQRAEKAARTAKEREALDLRGKVQELEARLARFSKTDMVADPIGFAEAHGLTEQEMALIGQAYMYQLVPDRAPPGLTGKLLEAKMARKEKLAEEARQREAEAMAAQQAQAHVQQYQAVLGAAVQTWDTAGAQHPYPSSQAWFGGSHEEYQESLVHTARNIADAAQERGEVADLSPKAVAAALERDIASRAARFRTPAAAPTQQSVKVEPAQPAPAGGKQPAVLSTKGQGGSPLPPATSDEERIKRAIEAAFPSR